MNNYALVKFYDPYVDEYSFKGNTYFGEKNLTKELIEDVELSNRFWDIWTKKEALIKCHGSGFAKKLNSFCVLESEKFVSYNVKKHIINICNKKKINFQNFWNQACKERPF